MSCRAPRSWRPPTPPWTLAHTRTLKRMPLQLYTPRMPWRRFGDPEQSNVPGFDPIREQYQRLDLNRWLKEHNVRNTAEAQGAVDQPTSDSTTLDAHEAQIVDWVNHRGRKCREDVARRLSDFERELASVENEQELNALEQEISQIETDADIALEGRLKALLNRLSGLQTDVVNAQNDLATFKQTSGLTRSPDYSHRSSVWKYILACILVEIVLNSSLLMEVNPQGLFGAIMLMTLISGVNVVVFGLPMGELLRLKNRRTQRTVAWTGIILFMSFAFVFNLAVGHYRDSVQSVATDRNADILRIGEDALNRLSNQTFRVDSINSIFLVLLGISCFGFASWKWLQRDDPYPGYGKRARKAKRTESTYIEEYDQAQAELRKVYRTFDSKLKDIRHKLQARQSKRRELCRRGERLVDEYPVNLRQYQHDLDFLLKAYRTANETVRESPAPLYFKKPVKVDSDILDPPSFHPPRESDIKHAMHGAHQTIRHLQGHYKTIHRGILTLDEVLLGGSEKVHI